MRRWLTTDTVICVQSQGNAHPYTLIILRPPLVATDRDPGTFVSGHHFIFLAQRVLLADNVRDPTNFDHDSNANCKVVRYFTQKCLRLKAAVFAGGQLENTIAMKIKRLTSPECVPPMWITPVVAMVEIRAVPIVGSADC
jgi:hypothetical protein